MAEEKVKTAEEAHAYTPGLKVKKGMIVLKVRRLPIPGDVLVNVGDKVDFETVVARTAVPGESHVVKVCLILGIGSDELTSFMTKKEGDPVKKGEPIAKMSTFFGLRKTLVPSDVDGFIDNISDITGQVMIKEQPIPVEVRAYIPGKVAEILPREGVAIQTYAAFVQGIFGIGGESYGELKVLASSPDEILIPEKVTAECKGKILVGGKLATTEAIKKAIQVGARGIIVGGVKNRTLIDILGYDIGVAITGNETLGISLIVTEGFGEMPMSDRTYNLLKAHDGHLAAINGTTQIRAGVQRPEIVVPLPPEDKAEEAGTSEELGAGMTPGTDVRIIRQPWFGQIGTVASLPVELVKVETESDVRVLTVRLGNGEIVTVPRANVEIIEA